MGRDTLKFGMMTFLALASSPLEEQAAPHTIEEHAATRGSQQFPASIPMFPVFSKKNAEPRTPHTPERREGLTPRYTNGPASAPHFGSPGFGVGASANQRKTIGSAGLLE